MSDININSVLSQIRSLREQAAGSALGATKDIAAGPDAPGFKDLLVNGLREVNEAQKTSAATKESFQLGESGTSLLDVMLASQKAKLEFRAAVEVRNRLVSAYQDIMNMPI